MPAWSYTEIMPLLRIRQDIEGEDMRILLIGNSYTYYNDMPKMLEALARANGVDAKFDAVTKGGARLIGMLDENSTEGIKIRELIGKGKYDILVLQEQSHTPITAPDVFLSGAKGMCTLVGADRTIYYATWGRKDGCSLLDELKLTSLGMMMGLEMAYERMAKLTGGELCAVGRAFAALSMEHPELELYNEDMSHPSYLGSAVSAISLYKTIFGKLPEATGDLDLDDWIIAIIKDIVDGM